MVGGECSIIIDREVLSVNIVIEPVSVGFLSFTSSEVKILDFDRVLFYYY